MQQGEKKRLAVQSQNFYVLNDTLYHKGADGIWHQTVRHDEKEAFLREAHYGIAGGHYVGDTTTRRIWSSVSVVVVIFIGLDVKQI